MKITHNNKTYIDAATHAGLRCWINSVEVEAVELLRSKYPNESPWNPRNVGDWAKDELIRYAVDPDSWRQPADAILVTDAEDHRKRWPLRNTHRHPLEDVGEKIELLEFRGEPIFKDDFFTVGKWSDLSDAPAYNKILMADGFAEAANPAPQPVDGGEWLKIHDTLIQYSNRSPVRWYSSDQSSGTDCWPWHFNINQGATPITPTQAAEWLRNNGHEAEAAKLEGDRFEPIGTVPVVGDRVLWTLSDDVFVIKREYAPCRWSGECQGVSGDLYDSDFGASGYARILKRRTGGNSKPTNPV